MGQIANQMVLELFLKLKQRLKEKKHHQTKEKPAEKK